MVILLLFHFLEHLKTSPVIYVLPDTRINTINKPFLLCVMINVIVQQLLPHSTEVALLTKVFSISSAEWDKKALSTKALAFQIPNMRDPCEESPSCSHFSPSRKGGSLVLGNIGPEGLFSAVGF